MLEILQSDWHLSILLSLSSWAYFKMKSLNNLQAAQKYGLFSHVKVLVLPCLKGHGRGRKGGLVSGRRALGTGLIEVLLMILSIYLFFYFWRWGHTHL